MKFSTLDFIPFPRSEIRDMLVRLNAVPAERLDEVTDLAVHAAERGAQAMLDVLDHTPDFRVQFTAVGIATGLLRGRLKLLEEACAAGALELGAKIVRGETISDA